MSANFSANATGRPLVQVQPFGVAPSGQRAELYTLANDKSMAVAITNYGATVVSLTVPDREGRIDDVVLGYDNVEGYEKGKAYFGGTIGRYSNRIAGGAFTLADRSYTLPKNEGENTLHGGIRGFNKRIWKAKEGRECPSVEFAYQSPDGEEGFPGNLAVQVLFTLLKDSNELRIEYSARTDKDTVVTLTNHSYFNLAGEGNGDVLSHILTLRASKFTPVNAALVPTGALREVNHTVFDFREVKEIGARIDKADEQLKLARGYDHNWVIDGHADPSELLPAAQVYEPRSGRVLEVLTTEPGVQFYSGNSLDGTERGKSGKTYPFRSGFCLETQHFPDSPNHPEFPSTLLSPGQILRSTTSFRFSVK
jgi:aldose 1-epimerase